MTPNSNEVIILITLLNILVYKLQQLQEAKFSEQTNQLSLSVRKLCRRFSLGDIQRATSNFHDEFVIGQGGFGKVYKGIIDFGASTVAIKRLKSRSKQGSREFLTEIEMLSKFQHSHLVSLVGYCDDSHEMILVYEYMPCGTLADHLYKRARNGDTSSPPLSWELRLKICVGAARGLDYLHTGTSVEHRVIHRDVKSTNILLDENMAAKISDFGLSKIGPSNQAFSTYVSTHVKGTPGYLDPYYFATHRLTRKSDVYSFGVVLFEVLCGRPAVDKRLDEEQRGLAGWAQHCFKEGPLDQIIDPSIKSKILPSSLAAFVKVAIQCLDGVPKRRPTMAEVVVGLESALALQESDTIYTLVERPITNCDQVHVEENKNSSLEEGVINGAGGGHHDEQSPARKTFTKKARLFLSDAAQMFSGHWDAKPSRNGRSKNKRIANMLVLKNEDVSQKSRERRSNNSMISNNMVAIKDEGVSQEARERRSNNNRIPNSMVVIKDEGVLAPNLKIFTLAELRKATRGFRPDTILGEGAFGMVFKGWVHENTYAPSKFGVGMAIAIKRHNPQSMLGFEEWQTEIKFMGNYSHANLVKLLGYCQEDEELFLVYEYMQRGSLDNYLNKSLPWFVRLKVLIGAGRCLAFFHAAEEQVILRDFKTAHILLDREFNAKLSNIGMAKMGPGNSDTHVSTRVMGTYGYAAPEYVATGHLNVKSDVYCFGVVLLELLTGMKVIDFTRRSEKANLVEWAKPFLTDERKVRRILDPSLANNFPMRAMLVVSSLILKCLDPYPKNRPSMVQVVETLETLAHHRHVR